MNFWIGLVKQNLCTNCKPGDETERKGWTWLDGSPYDADQTVWSDDEPTGGQTQAKFGAYNSSLTTSIGDHFGSEQFSFICSKGLKKLQPIYI